MCVGWVVGGQVQVCVCVCMCVFVKQVGDMLQIPLRGQETAKWGAPKLKLVARPFNFWVFPPGNNKYKNNETNKLRNSKNNKNIKSKVAKKNKKKRKL